MLLFLEINELKGNLGNDQFICCGRPKYLFHLNMWNVGSTEEQLVQGNASDNSLRNTPWALIEAGLQGDTWADD